MNKFEQDRDGHGFRACGKTRVSYQGIALALPQVFEISCPF